MLYLSPCLIIYLLSVGSAVTRVSIGDEVAGEFFFVLIIMSLIKGSPKIAKISGIQQFRKVEGIR